MEFVGADDMDGKLVHVAERAWWKPKAATSLDREMILEGRIFLLSENVRQPLPRSRLSVNRPSRPKDQQIFRE